MQGKNVVAERRGELEPLPVRYGRKLNNRARALLDDALTRLISGDLRATVGTHGRTFVDQLAHEILEHPLGSVHRIEAATPSDEDEGKKGDAPGVTNIGALYLAAVQVANKPAPQVIEGEIVSGTSRVQPELTDW